MKRKSLVYCVIFGVFVFSPLLGACSILGEPSQGLGQWTAAISLPEAQAGGMVRCSDDPDSFYIISGIIGEGFETSNRTYRYDINTANWQRLADMPAPLLLPALTCYQGNIYLAGGWDPVAYRAFLIYDIQADKWSPGNPLPEAVWGAAMGAWDGKLYLVGGDRGEGDFIPENQVDVYDIATGIWTTEGGAPMPTASGFYARAQSGSYLYVVGGFSGDFNNNVNQTQRYDMSTNTWEVGPTFTSARAYGRLTAGSSHLYMAGGDLNGGERADMTDLVEVLDLSSWPEGEWTDLGRPLPVPNLSVASTCTEVLTDGEIWNVGGVNTGETWHLYSEVYYLPIDDTCSDE
jgi:N-acetylneuraminic acid mutarotase